MRASLAGAAAILGVLLALAAALLWTAGREALDEDRFTERALAALRTPEGQEAIAARFPDSLPAATVADTVERTVPQPAFAAAMAPSLARTHQRVLELSGAPIEVDLEGLRALVAVELAAVDPALVALLPAPGALGALHAGETPNVPAIPAEDLEGRVPFAVGALSLAAAALLACAVALSRRPARLVRVVALALLILAAALVAASLAAPRLVEDAVDPPDEGLARRLTEELLGAWAWSAAALAIAGAGLALVATAASRSRRR